MENKKVIKIEWSNKKLERYFEELPDVVKNSVGYIDFGVGESGFKKLKQVIIEGKELGVDEEVIENVKSQFHLITRLYNNGHLVQEGNVPYKKIPTIF
jgi:hypothetical protein